MQFEILILFATFSIIIADVNIQPEYTRPYIQYQPIDRQYYFVPNQYRSYFWYGQPTFIPIYLNTPKEVNNQEDNNNNNNNPLLGSPQNPEIVSRHLHALKIGGHKIVRPSYVINTLRAPAPQSIVHQRFKKSVDNPSDSGKTGEANIVQPNSSINDQTTLKNNETQNPNNIAIKDKENQTTETKNHPTTLKTLFDLNPHNLIPNLLMSSTNQEMNNPTNHQDSKIESNLSNARNNDVDDEITKLENFMKNPIARNFNDPRLLTINSMVTSKPMESNIEKQSSKQDELKDPITGSIQMESSSSSMKPLVQQLYPSTWSSIYNNYPNPLQNNLIYPGVGYQPGVYMIYYSTDGSNKILIPKTNDNENLSPPQQQQTPCQNGMNQIIPSFGYTYLPQGQYNYLSNYMLEYPKLSNYYPLSIYPNNYLPYVQKVQQ